MALTWTRSKVPANIGTGTNTLYTSTLSTGDRVQIKSVEGTFFFYLNGERTHSFENSLKAAKAVWQRVEDRAAKA